MTILAEYVFISDENTGTKNVNDCSDKCTKIVPEKDFQTLKKNPPKAAFEVCLYSWRHATLSGIPRNFLEFRDTEFRIILRNFRIAYRLCGSKKGYGIPC
jgi:hypothetical protein